MTYIEHFKLQAKKLSKDYKTKTPYIDKNGDSCYKYNPKYFNVDGILASFDENEDNFGLMKAQDLIAYMAGFSKWTDLLKASEVELELAKLLFDNQDKISIEDWKLYIAEVEHDSKTTVSHENKLEIFKQVWLREYFEVELEQLRSVEQLFDKQANEIMHKNIAGIYEKCEYIEHKLTKGEKLTGKMLKFALNCIPSSEEKFFNGIKIRDKLKNGKALDDYELDIVHDFLLYIKLKSLPDISERQE